MAKQIVNQNLNIITGKVTDRSNHPLAKLIVNAYDKDMRNEELLGEAITDIEGRYTIHWSHSQLSGRGKKGADIVIKIFSSEKRTPLYASDIHSIRFNASNREEINITVMQKILPEAVEYDHLLKQIQFLAGKVPITDLQENEQLQDITFLSKEAEIPAEKIGHLAVAHRLQSESTINAAFFYALLRKNTLLKNHFTKSFQVRLAVDINTKTLPLLYDAALADPKVILQDIKAAAQEMIISAKLVKEASGYIAQLQRFKQKAEEYYQNEHPKKVLEMISSFVSENKLAEIGKLFEENKNNPSLLFSKLTSGDFFKSSQSANDAKIDIALVEILGFDETIITQVKDLQNIKKPEDVKKLAALNKTEWKTLLTKSASKIKIAGKSLDKKIIDLHASSLARKFEKEYPTIAFAAQLGREKKPIFKNQKEITGFLAKHTDFDLQNSNIDLFLKDKKMATQKNEAMKEELKLVQRIFKLIPHYGKTNALLEQKVHSSQSIVAAGKSRFVNEIAPKAGINAKEANEIYQKAEYTNTAAMLVIGKLHDSIQALDVPALELKSLPAKLQAVSKDFPNLKSLFKLTDVCACDHCRSVYSPAAYLVEILQFLSNRSVTDLTTTPPTHNTLAKAILFERRPDLGEIDLGCENANTPVPYIDLVCELLEEAIAPDTGIAYSGNLSDGAGPLTGKISNSLLATLTGNKIPVTDQAQIYRTEDATTVNAPEVSPYKPHYLRDKKAVCKIVHNSGNNYTVYRLRQTLSSAEELASAPEYLNESAYEKLSTQSYAFKLPFDLNHTEATTYFNRFDISRAELMKDFQVASLPSENSMAAEKLGLTETERELIVTPHPNIPNQQLYWNAPSTWGTPPVSGNVVDYMKIVDHFLTKTGLSYKELELLLSLSFINPTGKLFIKHNDLTCNTEKKEIANLDGAALDRIHRFLRLQKKTKWQFGLMDEIISQDQLGKGKLDNDCLVVAAQLLTLAQETNIKLNELTGFYGNIPHKIGPVGVQPLYHQVFLNKAKNGFIDDLLLPENVNGSQSLNDVLNSLSVCLQISGQDLSTLLPVLPDGGLTFSNLSYLFALSRLMKKLKVKVDEIIILLNLTGIKIWESPLQTLNFAKACRASKNLTLKPAEVQYMLQHNAIEIDKLEIKEDKIKQILGKLQGDYLKAFNSSKSPFDSNLTPEEQTAALQLMLSKLKGVSEEHVKTITQTISRDWVSVSDAKTKVDNIINGLFDTTSIKSSMDSLAGVPDGNDFSAESNALIEAWMKAICNHQLQKDKKDILVQTLTTTFKTTEDLITVVLEYAKLRQPAPGNDLIRDLLSDKLIDSLPLLLVINEINFPKQYNAIRLLHKLVPLIQSFSLENNDIEWYFKHNSDLGWFLWDSIPYRSSQDTLDYAQFMAFTEMLSLTKQYTPVPNPADAENPMTFHVVAEMLKTGSTVSRNDFIEAMSLLTGFDKTSVDELDNYLFSAWNLHNYRDPKAWERLELCMGYLRKLGCNIAQVKEFLKPTLKNDDVNTLRMALKSRYDEDTWLGTLKEITDAIRPQKRNALVAYLLATNPEIKDENDLYEYFLVDVEMEACMPSSRIVQAHGSIQLFVQRCLMGLEPKASADLNKDKNWEQWKWMKNYRVWEANRKVFLYPENWIEAELRDDKSFLFTELENELLQNELTEFTAEEGIIKYLEKLDNLSFLEIMATWYQSDIKTMHVFGRTKGGDPATYYYRKFEQEGYWTPWEKVDLDIAGDHLLAFVRNNRLTLAWLIFSEEADPNQKVKLPNQSDTTEQEIPRPRKKLKIQLAMSEFANNKWQPKKVSKDGILTPSYYTIEPFEKHKYNLMYFELPQQVWLITSKKSHGQEVHKMNGVFNIAGCKGYPELVPNFVEFYGKDFLPDFKDTVLNSQRYNELDWELPDDLSVKNGIVFFDYLPLLSTTPGIFRLTYPHQVTKIDIIVLLYQLFFLKLNNNDRNVSFKIPLGTLLPYFMEDSEHAYTIIPGFYQNEKNMQPGQSMPINRTGSNVMQLIDDIQALIVGFFSYKAKPSEEKKNELINEFQKIKAELKVYGGLQYGEQFKNMYHPLICALRKTLYKEGIPALMKRETQLQKHPFNFGQHYGPNSNFVPKMYTVRENGVDKLSYPVEDLDFTSDGSYSGYNWELFFHVPFMMATRLTQNQKFEEAMTWFHYMFNPTGALEGPTPQKYWVTKPFFLAQDNDYIEQQIDSLLYKIATPDSPEMKDLKFAIDQWREKPFKPHVVARFRPVAYQKALLMKYIDNLIEWGDYLFRQDTMESIAQATQMYVMADKLLGPKPRLVPPAIKAPYETYNQIEAKIDAFGNALIDLENIIPDLASLPYEGEELPPAPITLAMLYFCIPQNEKMLGYWDRVADRLFKIRHCQNIDGIERSLALFAPPIDPAMLVRAAASGLDISSILAGINAPTPYYRFNMLAQKATELAQEVRNLGSSLLQALEKKDAEAMSLLRGELEIKVLNAVKDMKILQIKEASEQITVLEKTKLVTQERDTYYTNIKKIITGEQSSLDLQKMAHDKQDAAQQINIAASVLGYLPNVTIGASGFGGSPHVNVQWGTQNIISALQAMAGSETSLSNKFSYQAGRASTLAGYERRFDDWKLQERIAKKELDSIDQQIAAAKTRKEIAETDLKNQELQIENAKKNDEFMRSKFTNKDLYQWMVGQVSSVYFRSYQLAHDYAKKAERSYRFELGNDDSFISFGYWDSMKKGLQSADQLIHDIKRMETNYLDKNKREYEVTKHVSLIMLDPLALVRLRATGTCDFDIPEALFDLDHAGQYFRRIKSVSISLPCIAGPYTSVSAKLSLVKNKYRKNTSPENSSNTGYLEDTGNDERFVYNVGAIQSIAASTSQNDSGMFELNFRDERYLPFEGTGAVSSWRLELPKKEFSQFNYDTISDVVIHIKYTAREGGSSLKGLAETSLKDRLAEIKQQLSQKGLHVAINMKYDLSNEWHLFKANGTINLTIDKSRLPYMAQTMDAAIENVMIVVKVTGNPGSFVVYVNGNDTNLSRIDEWKLCRGNTASIELGTPFTLSVDEGQITNVEELMMMVKYSF